MVYRVRDDADEGDLLTGSRVCRLCEKRKPMTEFHWANRQRHRRRTCKGCDYKRSTRTRALNPAKYARAARARTFLRKYGITLEGFDALLVEQRYRCRICLERLYTDTTHVDHDHQSGRVRGLLCTNCNLGLGHFRDDPWRLRGALAYLRTEASGAELKDVA
jgi:Recombination endonuclease VII